MCSILQLPELGENKAHSFVTTYCSGMNNVGVF